MSWRKKTRLSDNFRLKSVNAGHISAKSNVISHKFGIEARYKCIRVAQNTITYGRCPTARQLMKSYDGDIH